MECALCRHDREIRRSHIIPEFLYEAMYDEKHRFHVLSVIEDQKDWMEQKGLREPLLCDDCETKISRFEDYGRRVLKGGAEFEFQREGSAVIVEGLDYRRFKLFQLSILWRAGVSTLDLFQHVKLGPFEENLRNMVLDEQPGKQEDFGCVMFGLKNGINAIADLIVQPVRTRSDDGHCCYRFVFGGFQRVFFVSSKPNTGSYSVGFLQESGRLCFVVKSVFEANWVSSFGKRRAQLGRVSQMRSNIAFDKDAPIVARPSI